MALPTAVATSSLVNSNHPPAACSLAVEEIRSSAAVDPPPSSLGSVDDLLCDIYVDGAAAGLYAGVEDATASAAGGVSMTLEDFLTRAGTMTEEDVGALGMCGDERFDNQQEVQSILEVPILGFGDGMVVGGGGGSGRKAGKRQAVLDPVDRVALQRQKRMIKNRESAARSRERKQAYTVELESLVAQLEDENSQLVMEEEERQSLRLKQIMENVIPVTEKKRPRRALRKTRSFQL